MAGLYATACPVCREPVEAQFILHGRRQACSCGPVTVVDSMVLKRDRRGRLIRLCEYCLAITEGADACSCEAQSGRPPVVEKRQRCPTCGAAYHDDLWKPYYARYEPLVVAGRCVEHGAFFAPVSHIDALGAAQAAALAPRQKFAAPAFAVVTGPKSSDLLRSGIAHFPDLFSDRQLIYLSTAAELLRELDPLARLNLALLVSTSLDFNCMLCGYKGASERCPGAVRHVFSHHGYSFPYTALENNPIYPGIASGSLPNLFKCRITRAKRWAARPVERLVHGSGARMVAIDGEEDAGTEVGQPVDLASGQRRFMLVQGTSASLPLPSRSVDFVVTDPPYFDSVQYSDLARFFRVWLQDLAPDAASWDYDVAASVVAGGGASRADYEANLGSVLAECRRVLKDEGLLILTFHHWRAAAWAALTRALQHAGFFLADRYVVHSENTASVHIVNRKALTHDAILFLTPRMAKGKRPWRRPAR
jgi:hypothetical protein